MFPVNKISIPAARYIDTVSAGYHLRHIYYGTGTHFVGTIFTDLRNGTISDDTKFYKDTTIEEAVEESLHKSGVFLFWFFWIVIICGVVYAFYYADNRWLD